MLEIQNSLTGQRVPGILAPARKFIHEGKLMKVANYRENKVVQYFRTDMLPKSKRTSNISFFWYTDLCQAKVGPTEVQWTISWWNMIPRDFLFFIGNMNVGVSSLYWIQQLRWWIETTELPEWQLWWRYNEFSSGTEWTCFLRDYRFQMRIPHCCSSLILNMKSWTGFRSYGIPQSKR